MNPKFPSKELELKKKERWLNEEKDPWRGVTDMLATIDPLHQVPKDYNYNKLHDKIMSAVQAAEPTWKVKLDAKNRS